MKTVFSRALKVILSFAFLFSFVQNFAHAADPNIIMTFKNPGSFIVNEDVLPYLGIDKKGNKTLVISIDYSKDITFKESLTGIDVATGKIKWSKRKISSHITVDPDRNIIYMYSTKSNTKNTITAINMDGKELWKNQIPESYNHIYINKESGDVTVVRQTFEKSHVMVFNTTGKLIKTIDFDGYVNYSLNRYWIINDVKNDRNIIYDYKTGKTLFKTNLYGTFNVLNYGTSSQTFLISDVDYQSKRTSVIALDSSGNRKWKRDVYGKPNEVKVVNNSFIVVTESSISAFTNDNKLTGSKQTGDLRYISLDSKSVAYETPKETVPMQINIFDPKTLKEKNVIKFDTVHDPDNYSANFVYLGNNFYYQRNLTLDDAIDVIYNP